MLEGNILQSWSKNTFLEVGIFLKINIFQFFTNFTKIAQVSHIIKLQFSIAPL